MNELYAFYFQMLMNAMLALTNAFIIATMKLATILVPVTLVTIQLESLTAKVSGISATHFDSHRQMISDFQPKSPIDLSLSAS